MDALKDNGDQAPPVDDQPPLLQNSIPANLDAAPAQPVSFAPDVESRAAPAHDHQRPLQERQEAFEDLIDSEVGDTSLSRARNLERQTGLRQLYVKFEGGNPTGTQKDRIAFAQAMDALRRGYDGVTLATCGNYGAAMARAAAAAGLRCVILLPAAFRTRRIREMEQGQAEIIRCQSDYEGAVVLSRQLAADQDLYDANPGGPNTMLQLMAYADIAREIYDELRDAPAVVAVSVSNGTTLAGIYKGFVSLYRRGKTSRIPRMVAGSSFNKNPIIKGFQKNTSQCLDLAPEQIRETAVNEPLVNWHSVDGDHALNALRCSGGWVGQASDRNLVALARSLRDCEGLHVLPAATAGLLALIDGHRKNALPNDRYVAVLTGRKA